MQPQPASNERAFALLQVAMLPVKAGDASFEAGAVQLPYRGGEYYGGRNRGGGRRGSAGWALAMLSAGLLTVRLMPPLTGFQCTPAAVVAAPRGELSSEAAQNGQRGLVAAGGLVP